MKCKFKVFVLISIIACTCISCTFAQAGRLIGGEGGQAVGMVMDSGVSLGNSAGKALKNAITNKTPKTPKTPKTTKTTKTPKTNNKGTGTK